MDVLGGSHQDGGREGGADHFFFVRRGAADHFFLSAAAAVPVPRTVDAVASASVVVLGTSVCPTRHFGVPAVVVSLVELVLAAVAVGLPLPGVMYVFGLFETLKYATADVLADVLDKPLL